MSNTDWINGANPKIRQRFCRPTLNDFGRGNENLAAASRSIDVYVGRVRRKLRRGRHAIATVRGGGYQFVPGPRTKVRGPAEYSI